VATRANLTTRTTTPEASVSAAAAAAATLFRLRLLAESKHADGGNWPSSNLMTATTHQKIFFAVLETTLPPRRPTWRL